MANSCENGNEVTDSTKDWEFLAPLSHFQHLSKDSDSMHLLVSVVYTRVIDIQFFDFIVCSITAIGSATQSSRFL
jgi:hypothetical protein